MPKILADGSVYIICPVRNADPGVLVMIKEYVERVRALGIKVHYPPEDAPQECTTGIKICETHRDAMLAASEVHVFWDVESKGSHFDLGMAYALGKPVVKVWIAAPDPQNKSYWKVMDTMAPKSPLLSSFLCPDGTVHAWNYMTQNEAYPAQDGRTCQKCKKTELAWFGPFKTELAWFGPFKKMAPATDVAAA